MELNCTDVVKMASKSEDALLGLVVPNFDFVVVSSTYEHRLCFMEVNTSHRA